MESESQEIFDVVDETNTTVVDLVARPIVHKTGLLHRAVNVILTNAKDEILLQKRVPTKVVCPSLWDLSCAEHLTHLETYKDGALRGLREELSITSVESIERIREARLFKFDDEEKGVHDHEFTECYLVHYNGEITIDEGEVAEVKYVTKAELKRLLDESPNSFTPWALADFKAVVQ